MAAPHPPGAGRNLLDISRTLWVCNLDAWMDEAYLNNTFTEAVGPIENIRLLQDRATGISRGFAFIQFAGREYPAQFLERIQQADASEALFIGRDGHRFKVAWAGDTQQRRGDRPREPQRLPTDVTLYVGDLDGAATEQQLLELFTQRFSSVVKANVISDTNPDGTSRCFGFVRFRDARDAELALTSMQKAPLAGKPIRLRRSKREAAAESGAPETKTAADTSGTAAAAAAAQAKGHAIVIPGIYEGMQEAHVIEQFGIFGDVLRAQLLPDLGCTVIEFRLRPSAEAAVAHLHEHVGVPAQFVDAAESQAQMARHQFQKMQLQQQQQQQLQLQQMQQMQQEQLQQQSQQQAPRVTNMTNANAVSEVQKHVRAQLSMLEQPSLEHFQALLQDPAFVKAFEQQLAVQKQGGASGRLVESPPELPWLLQDRPELFQMGSVCVDEMNDDFLSARGFAGFAGRTLPSLSLLSLEMRVLA